MYAVMHNPMIHNLLEKQNYHLTEDFACPYYESDEEKNWMRNHHSYIHRVSHDEDFPSYSKEEISISYTNEINFSLGRYERQHKTFSYRHFLGTREQFDRAVFNTLLYFFAHWNLAYHKTQCFQLVA
jgi:hypothetical protein